MKRLFYGAGIVLTLGFFGSCAQHDPESPDTSGAVPYGESVGTNSTGVDTLNTGVYGDSTVPNIGPDSLTDTNQNNERNTQINR